MKSSQVIQPVGCAAPLDPAGAPFNIDGLNLTRGNTANGGTALPIALTHPTTVTSIPLSPEVT